MEKTIEQYYHTLQSCTHMIVGNLGNALEIGDERTVWITVSFDRFKRYINDNEDGCKVAHIGRPCNVEQIIEVFIAFDIFKINEHFIKTGCLSPQVPNLHYDFTLKSSSN